MASRTERTRQTTDQRHPLNGHLGVVPRLKSRKSFIKCTEPINTTAKAARMELWRERLEPLALDASVHLNIGPDEHLPAGAENPWTTWKALNRLRSQVGRSRVNMLKWGFSNEQETCDCGIRQTMQHLLVCPMMDTAQGRSKRSGWSGHGRTNNRAGKLYLIFLIFLIFLLYLFGRNNNRARIFFDINRVDTVAKLCTLTIRF